MKLASTVVLYAAGRAALHLEWWTAATVALVACGACLKAFLDEAVFGSDDDA